MKRITVGLPKAYLYYRYHVLWETFFTTLGCNVINSGETTKEIIDTGKKLSIDESCLSSKIYLGHVAKLQNKCDYILIPRIQNYGKNEQVCVKFNATYDIVKNLFPNLKILDYNIERTKNPIAFLSYLRLGFSITKNPIKILFAYLKSRKKNNKYFRQKEQEQSKKLNKETTKILLVSHPYNIYDNYIGKPIIQKIESMGLEIIYANLLNVKLARMYSKRLSPTLYWHYSKELIGAIEYYQYAVSGIIFLTTFPCGPDSLVNELMIRKVTTLPITNILIDEQSASTGIDTRLESFIDIVQSERSKSE